MQRNLALGAIAALRPGQQLSQAAAFHRPRKPGNLAMVPA